MACGEVSHYRDAAKLWKKNFIFQFFATVASYKIWGHLKKKVWCTWLAEWLPELRTGIHFEAVHGFLMLAYPLFGHASGSADLQLIVQPVLGGCREKKPSFAFPHTKLILRIPYRALLLSLWCSLCTASSHGADEKRQRDRIFKKGRQILWLSALLLPWYVPCQNLP